MNARGFAKGCLAVAAAGIALAAVPQSVHALAQRTFVASNGVDTNACSLAAPCRGFARAITQTADKGEIIVLDSAGYGAVTINKSVAIIAPPGVYAGISVFTGSGVTVATSGVKVLLRGLTINGQGGSLGIDFAAGGGAELVVEQCTIAKMAGDGVLASSASSRIVIRDSVVGRNTANGIIVSQATKATIDRSRVDSNGQNGILFVGGPWATISESIISGNGGHGVSADASATVVLQVSIDRSVIVESDGNGIYAAADNTSEVRMAVARSTLARNVGAGVEIVATLGSLAFGEFSDNEITGNGRAGIRVLDAAVANAVGNRITRNYWGYINDGVLRSLGNNLIEDNTSADIGGIAIIPGK